MNLNTFNPVQDRLGAVSGLESDHVPIDFTVLGLDAPVGSMKILSYNLSNEAAHRWFAEPGNAYGNTDLVVSPDTLEMLSWGKVMRQLEYIATMIKTGEYDVALIQEADPISLGRMMTREAEFGMRVYSDLLNADSAFHGKTWAMSAIMVADKYTVGDYSVQFKNLSGEYEESNGQGRKMRTELPIIVIGYGSMPMLQIASAHIRGNDAQNPAEGIKHASRLMYGHCFSNMPMILAGDFNTVPDNIRAATGSKWELANPAYITHMCRYDSRYCLAAYDNVLYQSCDVRIGGLPNIPPAKILHDALNQ